MLRCNCRICYRSNHFELISACLSLCCFSALGYPAFAAEATDSPSAVQSEVAPESLSDAKFFPEDWAFQIAPWLWALSVEGDASVRGVSTDVDIGFDDLLDQLNVGAFVEFEARKGRFGVFGNLMYADLGTDKTVGPLEIQVGSTTLMAGAGAGYRLGPWRLDVDDGASDASLVLEPFAGVRYTYVDAELDSNVDALNVSRDKDWVDPIVGARAILQMSPNWTVTAVGDVGGFGVGSELTWQALGLVGYDFDMFAEKNASFAAGYRALAQDYESGSGAGAFTWDVVYHGPLLALSIRF